MKAALYLRVSSESQHTDNQLPELQNYAGRRGWEIIAVYAESETAWKSGHQQELARLLHDCRKGHGRVDIVLCWALETGYRGKGRRQF
ncbi:MAG: recombinase family protein [Chloroflexi bacterium]|nr:recombinase family protein [Chloroflexota bacterium]